MMEDLITKKSTPQTCLMCWQDVLIKDTIGLFMFSCNVKCYLEFKCGEMQHMNWTIQQEGAPLSSPPPPYMNADMSFASA